MQDHVNGKQLVTMDTISNAWQSRWHRERARTRETQSPEAPRRSELLRIGAAPVRLLSWRSVWQAVNLGASVEGGGVALHSSHGRVLLSEAQWLSGSVAQWPRGSVAQWFGGSVAQ